MTDILPEIARGVTGKVLRPRGCDDEVASIMDQLDRLQTWLVLKGVERRGDREYMSAATLIQNTRCLIVERCFKPAAIRTHILTEGQQP